MERAKKAKKPKASGFCPKCGHILNGSYVVCNHCAEKEKKKDDWLATERHT